MFVYWMVYMNNNDLKETPRIMKSCSCLNVDSILGIALVFLSLIFIYYLIPNYIEEPESIKNIMMSPRYIPNLAGWFILILSVFLLLQGVRNPKRSEGALLLDTPILRWLLMLGALATYAFLFEILGAIASAFFASACLLIANHIKNIWLYVLVLVFPIAVYLLFVYVLHVPLPLGDVWE